MYLTFFFLEKVSGSPGWPWTYQVDKHDLELLILLPPNPKCCDYRLRPNTLGLCGTVTEFRASCTLAKHSTNEVTALVLVTDLKIIKVKMNKIYLCIWKHSCPWFNFCLFWDRACLYTDQASLNSLSSSLQLLGGAMQRCTIRPGH